MIREVLEVLAQFKDEVTAPMRGMADGVKGIGRDIETGFNNSLKNMAAGLAGFFALRSLASFFADAIRGAAEEEKSMAALRVAIENTGGSYKDFGATAEAAVEAERKLTTFTDKDLRGALARLITATGDASGSTANLGLVADIAAARHIDLSKAADVVAKAMEGNYTALKRIGIFIEAGQDGMAVLRERFDGAAVAAANADSGIGRLAQSWDHFTDVIGENILKQDAVKGGIDNTRQSLEDIGAPLGNAIGWFIRLAGAFAHGFGNWAESVGLQVDSIEAFLQELFGKGLVWFAEFESHALGWIPGIGKGIKATAASVIAFGQGMVDNAETTFHNIEALQKESGEKTTSAAEKYTTKVITTDKAQWDAHIANVLAGASTEVSESQGAKDKIAAAQKKLNDILKLYYKEDAQGRVTTTRQGQDAIEIAETNLAQAKITLTDKVSKKAEEAAAKRQKEEDAATAALLRITNEFLKDFAGEIPAAAAVLTKKIADLTAQADTWAKSTDPKIRAQADAVRALAVQYQNIVPILTDLGTLAEAVSATEKDPERFRSLDQLNVELDKARILQSQTGDNTLAINEADKLVLRIQGDITKETQREKDEAFKVGQTLHEQVPDRQEFLALQLKHRDAVAQTAHEAVGLVVNLGLVDGATGKALDDVISIASAMSNLSASTAGFTQGLSLANVGTLIGAVGAFGSLLGGLFGKNPDTARREALLLKNTERLAELSTEIHALNMSTPGGVVKTMAGLDAGKIPVGTDRSRVPTGTIGKSELASYLSANGLTMADFRQMAGDAQIDLGESGTGFAKDAVGSVFAWAKGALAKPIFGTDFAGRQAGSEAYRTATGTDTTDQKVTDIEANLAAADSKWLAGMLSSFDVSSASGRSAARSAIGGLIQQISAGTFDMGLMGNTVNSSDFLGALNSFIGYLGEYDSAASSAAPSAPSAPYTPPAAGSADSAGYTPAPSPAYVPSASMAWDLSPVVNVILQTNAILDSHTGILTDIADTNAAMADAIAGGALLATVSTGLARSASLTGVNAGTRV